MSVADAAQALTIPGRLCLGPTQPGVLQAFPHGGTAIGYVREAALERLEESVPIHAESRALQAGRVVGRNVLSFAFVLVQYDLDVLKKLWAYNTTSGGGFSGATNLVEPNVGATLQPGVRLGDGVSLLFAPDDVRQPGVLIRNPEFTVGPNQQRVAYSILAPNEHAVVVLAYLDASNRVLEVGKLENLTL